MEKWFVVQTRARWEKKVADCLQQKGIQSFCPLRKVQRKWSDRVKIIDEPVFRSCVFVKISPEQRTAVRLTDGVINFLYEHGKPVVVKEKEIYMLCSLLPVSDMLLFENQEKKQGGKQHKSLQTYLDNFSQWLMTCMDRPKLA